MKFTTAISSAVTAATALAAAPSAASSSVSSAEAGTMHTALVTPLRAPSSDVRQNGDVPHLPRPVPRPPSQQQHDALAQGSLARNAAALKRTYQKPGAMHASSSFRSLEESGSELGPPLDPPAKPAPKPKPAPAPVDGLVDGHEVDGVEPVAKPPPKPKPAPPALEVALRHLLGAEGEPPKPKPKPKPAPGDVPPHLRGQSSAQDVAHGLEGFRFAEREDVRPANSVRASSKPEPKSKPQPKPAPGSSTGSGGPTDPGVIDGMPFVGAGGASGGAWDYYSPYTYAPLDYDTLQAELALTATEHSQEYVEAYYSALSTVRNQCYVDYISYCQVAVAIPLQGDPNSGSGVGGDDDGALPIDGIISDLISTLFPSTSTTTATSYTTTSTRNVFSDMINSVSGLFFSAPSSVTVVELSEGDDDSYSDRRRSRNRRVLHDDHKHKAAHHEHDHSDASSASSSGEEPASGAPFMVPLPPAYTNGGSTGSSDGSTTITIGYPGDGVAVTTSWNSAPPSDVFIAPLGFGATGDSCMYSNYYNLQPMCRASINEVYVLHNQYVAEEEEAHSGHHSGLLFLLLITTGILGGLHIMRRFGPEARKREDAHYIIAAIRNNPGLKAQVEAASGRTVPMLDASGTCGQSKLLRIAGVVALVFVCTTITLHIARELVYVDADGEEHVPNAIIVFLLMLAVTMLAVGVLYALYVVYRRVTAPEQPVFVNSSAPSGFNNNGSGGSSGGARGFTRSVFRWGRDLLNGSSASSSSRRGGSGDYAPMYAPDSPLDSSSGEGVGAEMQSMSKATATLQQQHMQHQHQHQMVPIQPLYYTGVPVAAPMAMSGASFIPIATPQQQQQQQHVVYASQPVQMHSNVAMI